MLIPGLLNAISDGLSNCFHHQHFDNTSCLELLKKQLEQLKNSSIDDVDKARTIDNKTLFDLVEQQLARFYSPNNYNMYAYWEYLKVLGDYFYFTFFLPQVDMDDNRVKEIFEKFFAIRIPYYYTYTVVFKGNINLTDKQMFIINTYVDNYLWYSNDRRYREEPKDGYDCLEKMLPKEIINQPFEVNERSGRYKSPYKSFSSFLSFAIEKYSPFYKEEDTHGDWSLVRFIKNTGCNIDEIDKEGRTLLHRFVERENTKMLKDLLDLGANPLLTDKNGLTPYENATRDKWKEGERILYQYSHSSLENVKGVLERIESTPNANVSPQDVAEILRSLANIVITREMNDDAVHHMLGAAALLGDSMASSIVTNFAAPNHARSAASLASQSFLAQQLGDGNSNNSSSSELLQKRKQ